MYGNVLRALYSSCTISEEDLITRSRRIISSYSGSTLNKIQPDVDLAIYQHSNDYFTLITSLILSSRHEASERLLDEYMKLYNSLKDTPSEPYLRFTLSRVQGLSKYCLGEYKLAKKILSSIVANCPRINGYHMSGLVDVLIMLSECYTAVGKVEDSLYCARLAITITHKRAELLYNLKSRKARRVSTWLAGDMSPSLPTTTAACMSYYNMAIQLDNNNLSNLSEDWYQRAYSIAQSERLSKELKDAIIMKIPKIPYRENSDHQSFSTDNDSDTFIQSSSQSLNSGEYHAS